MKIALDPYMFRSVPLLELPALVADLGYEYIELSPREDFTPFFLMPRCDDATVKRFKRGLDAAGVRVAANLPLYRWSGPDEDDGRRRSAGGNMVEIMEYAGDLITQLHLADSFDHTGSSGLRYILNPPGTAARIHQHLDIGQGEVDWDTFFATLDKLGFGDREETIMTSCVFAWEERARESSTYMRETIAGYVEGWGRS